MSRVSIARIEAIGGAGPVGSGFLLSPQVVVTCSHVLNAALREEDLKASAQPEQTLRFPVTFPYATNENVTGSGWVCRWIPPTFAPGRLNDIAFLMLETPLTEELQGFRLDRRPLIEDEYVFVDGFPEVAPNGLVGHGKVTKPDALGHIACHTLPDQLEVRPGHSGSPVFRRGEDAVCGMACAVLDRNVPFVIPVDHLVRAWPPLKIDGSASVGTVSKPINQRCPTRDQILKAFRAVANSDRESVFTGSDMERMEQTIRNYVPVGEILAFIDTTKVNNGSSGVAVMMDGLHWRNAGAPSQERHFLSWDALFDLADRSLVNAWDEETLFFGPSLLLTNNEIRSNQIRSAIRGLAGNL